MQEIKDYLTKTTLIFLKTLWKEAFIYWTWHVSSSLFFVHMKLCDQSVSFPVKTTSSRRIWLNLRLKRCSKSSYLVLWRSRGSWVVDVMERLQTGFLICSGNQVEIADSTCCRWATAETVFAHCLTHSLHLHAAILLVGMSLFLSNYTALKLSVSESDVS